MGQWRLGFECKPRLKYKWTMAGRDAAKAEHGPSYGAASVPSKSRHTRLPYGDYASCVIRPLLRPPEVIMTAANSPASKEIVTAALLVIGGKILSGRTKDRNIGYIAEYLTALGIDLREVRVVPDVEAEIV